MFTQWFSLLFFFGSLFIIKASSWRSSSITCPIPDIDHGRVVVRGYRGKMIKFVCDKRYELAGNKYATCRGDNWDVPIPVCIRAGCRLPPLDNGVQIPTSNGAYVTHFCFPGFMMVGSAVIYCDGREWNATVPTCVDSTQTITTNCDFEDPGLCGWTQDEMHDFDWTRLNKKTPSFFMSTGPSYDHTYGKNGSGYYMYIESTSRLRNDTARFISPIYNKGLSENGCFSFYYHMFGNTCGGLRVYQKPDNMPLQNILKLSGSLKNQYILFEKWGNHGDIWLNAVSSLTNFGENFQIIIEGIRGSSFTSDIAIDDVAILQGENCTAAMDKITTPSVLYMPDSCAGRCMSIAPSLDCGCSSMCIANNDCCFDFLELCVFQPDSTSSDDGIVASNETPHTQKQIGTLPHTTSTSTTTSTATSTTSTTTTTTTTTPQPTTTTRRKTTPIPVTTSKITTTPISATTPRPTNTPRPTRGRRPTSKTIPTTTPIPTITTRSTTTLRNSNKTVTVPTTKSKIKSTTEIAAISSTKKPTIPWNSKTITNTNTTSTKRPTTSTKITTTDISHGISRTIENHNEYHDIVEKAKKEKAIEVRKLHQQNDEPNKSSGWKVVFIILGTVICLASISWLVVVSRSSRGRIVLARLRGRCNQDPEVRYLSTDVDD